MLWFKNKLSKTQIKKFLGLRWQGQTYQCFANIPLETLPTNGKVNNHDNDSKAMTLKC